MPPKRQQPKNYRPTASSSTPTSDGTLTELEKCRQYLRAWVDSTRVARREMGIDYEYVDGHQWKPQDRHAVEKTGRPALTFNKVLPQVELVCGLQRGVELDTVALPRGLEDRRLGQLSTAALKAASDFTDLTSVSNRVFDDGTICGLGAWEILHTVDDVDDLLWGEIAVSRINPRAFIYDVWATQPNLQDGSYMGKASWVTKEYLHSRYTDNQDLFRPGEWLGSRGVIGDARDFGTSLDALTEFWDQRTGRVRLVTLWEKRPVTLTLIADQETGEVIEAASKDDAEQRISTLVREGKRLLADKLTIGETDTEATIQDRESGQPVGQFTDAAAAQQALNKISETAGMAIHERYQVITRKAMKPYRYELCWWQILAQGPSPFRDRNYPYVPYIGRRFSDDAQGIHGIVRPIRDAQDEYNKRYSQLLAHLNSSAHSGWLNRKGVGADTKQLELMGSKPGIVVEYASIAPTRIEPSALSSGHFALLPVSENNIKTTTGINAEMIGNTTQATVSGRAIRARQQGGLAILKPRLQAFEDAQLEVAKMLFSRIQQYYPPEKIRRIIGIAELSQPLGQGGQQLFANLTDEQVIEAITMMKLTKFDLVLAHRPSTPTERQAEFEQAIQMMGLMTSSGRPVGPNTMQQLLDLSTMPAGLAEALKEDMAQPAQPAVTQPGGQNEHMHKMISNIRGGRAGGGEGIIGNA